MSTRSDLDQAKTDLRAELVLLRAEMKADIADLRAELKADIADLRAELKADIAGLRAEVKADIADLRAEFAHLRGEVMGGIEKAKVDMIRWVIGLMLAQAGVTWTACYFLATHLRR